MFSPRCYETTTMVKHYIQHNVSEYKGGIPVLRRSYSTYNLPPTSFDPSWRDERKILKNFFLCFDWKPLDMLKTVNIISSKRSFFLDVLSTIICLNIDEQNVMKRFSSEFINCLTLNKDKEYPESVTVDTKVFKTFQKLYTVLHNFMMSSTEKDITVKPSNVHCLAE
jgi:hypothetical protein